MRMMNRLTHSNSCDCSADVSRENFLVFYSRITIY